MYRSWAYILMLVATLAGVVALLWPNPPVRTIEEITMPAHTAPRSESPAKPARAMPKGGQGAKAAPKPATAAPAPPAVVKRIPVENTTTHRSGPLLEKGVPSNLIGRPPTPGAAAAPAPGEHGTKLGPGVFGRTPPTSRPSAIGGMPPRDAAAK